MNSHNLSVRIFDLQWSFQPDVVLEEKKKNIEKKVGLCPYGSSLAGDPVTFKQLEVVTKLLQHLADGAFI